MEETVLTFLTGAMAFAFAAFTAPDDAEPDGSVTKSMSAVAPAVSTAVQEFLRQQAIHDTADSLAGEFCQLLGGQLNCDRVAHLALRHDRLDLSHAVGFTPADHTQCRIPLTDELRGLLLEHPFPRPLADIEHQLAAEVHQCLTEIGFDWWLPITWRRRVYGLYFLRCREQRFSDSIATVMSALSRVVASSFRLEALEDRVAEIEAHSTRSRSESRLARSESDSQALHPLRVLRLVRHHDSDTLVGHIVDELQRDLSLSKYLFVYESRRPDQPLKVYHGGVTPPPAVPNPDEFRELIRAMRHHDPDTAIELQSATDLISPLRHRLQKSGLRFAVAFPVSRTRSGLLAWDDRKPADAVLKILRQHRHSFRELMENAESFERVEELSYKDNLTGLANRRYFSRRLIEEIGRAKRYHRSLGLIMLDLDELKSINDSYGHQAGDEVLRQLGGILRNSIRGIDVTARYGGDEFCVIMPESDRITCLRFMNRLKHKIAGSKFSVPQLGKELTCTISQGGAVFPENGVTSDQLIFAADMALLRSKDKGRNQYHVFER